MTDCIATLKVCQGPNARYPYAFNLTDEFARQWQPNYPFAANAAIRPSDAADPTGWQYRNDGSDGVSGAEEPEWPTADNEDVADGSVEWTAEAMDFDGLAYRITDVNWTVPDGITGDDDDWTDLAALQECRIWVSGGEVGRTYTLVGVIDATDGTETAKFEVRLVVKIK